MRIFEIKQPGEFVLELKTDVGIIFVDFKKQGKENLYIDEMQEEHTLTQYPGLIRSLLEALKEFTNEYHNPKAEELLNQGIKEHILDQSGYMYKKPSPGKKK